MPQGKVNLKTIARECEVSVITASRALRGIGRVNPETRTRILEAADRLGYTRHHAQLAPGLRNAPKSEHCLKALLPLFKSPHSNEALGWSNRAIKSIHDGFEAMGGRMTVVEVEDIDDLRAKLPRARIQGIILRQVLPEDWLREILMIAPVVYAVSHDVVPHTDAIYFNDLKASTLIYDRLLSLGHRSIAWVSWEKSSLAHNADAQHFDPLSGFDRQAFNFTRSRTGAQMVMDLGMEDNKVLHQHIILPGTEGDKQAADRPKDAARRDGQIITDAILQLERRPTAVVICSPYSAAYAHLCLREAGLRIPREMSLMTYNLPNFYDSDHLRVSGAMLPFQKVGQMLPEIIQRRISNPAAPYMSVMLEADFVDYGTASRAPA